METVKLTTKDNVKLIADYYPAASDRAVILFHSNRTDRSVYNEFAKELNSRGYNILNVDLRGHGDSEGVLKNFTENDFLNMFNDALAADEYLRQVNPDMKVQMVGASIGANTALRFQEMNTLDSVVALSPGFNYHGIDPRDSNLGNIACPIFYLNTEGDNWSSETKQLYEESPLKNDRNKLLIVPGEEHGTDLLENTTVKNAVLDWLDSH